MQIIAVLATFAVTALAAPAPQQWGGSPFEPPSRSPFGFDGNEEGAYFSTCGCSSGFGGGWGGGQQIDPNLSQRACFDLNSQYPNLTPGGRAGCIDQVGRGIERNGMDRACQRAAGFGGGWGGNVRAVCFP